MKGAKLQHLTKRKASVREGGATSSVSSSSDKQKGPVVRIRGKRWTVIGILAVLALVLLTSTRVSMSLHPSTSNTAETVSSLRRFPKFHSPDFVQQCNWTLPSSSDASKFSIYVTPTKGSNEGIAWWVSKIAEAFIYTKFQGKNCKVLIDYGKDVDLSQIVVPPISKDSLLLDWRVPSADHDCKTDSSCQFLNWVETVNRKNGVSPELLDFRFAYSNTAHFWQYRDSFEELETKLLGYRPELAVACALTALLQLSPQAVQYEPRLFTHILPTLQSNKNLVLALYMRTGLTDQVVRHEQNTRLPLEQEADKTHQKRVTEFEHCAFSLEERYLSESSSFDRVVWLVVSDSPHLKDYMIKKYQREAQGILLPRQVITTQSRGKHTKPNHHVDTNDFAEAFLDWYLIGESDVVIADEMSTFGPTGALRTARPLYRVGNCTEPRKLIH